MIDFIKVKLPPTNIRSLENSALLNFKALIDLKTRIINEDVKRAKFKNLEFRIVKNRYLTLSGSIHRYWEKDGHNYGSYNLHDVSKTIQDLSDKFNINPITAKLSNLEYGLNLTNLPLPPKEIIMRCISHKASTFSNIIDPDTEGIFGCRIDRQRYSMKIYNKGYQYSLKEPTLRFEIKVKKMIHLKHLDIVCLSDLLETDVYNGLGNILFKTFMEILFAEKKVKSF